MSVSAAAAVNSPELRNQFQMVVGSLENILTEIKEVASDLRVVVNQIDDVTNRIESNHTDRKQRQSVMVSAMGDCVWWGSTWGKCVVDECMRVSWCFDVCRYSTCC